MKLYAYTFCILLSVCLVPLAVRAADNPIFNTSFDRPNSEDGGNSKGPCYSIVDGKGRDGGGCLIYRKEAGKLLPEGRKENFHYDFVVPVQPHLAYVASAWFKTEADLRPSLRIATKDWQTLAAGICADTKDWQELRVAFQSGANSEIRVQIFGGGKTDARESEPGTSYCDDVTVRQPSGEDALALRQCRVTVEAGTVLRQINPLFFGVNTLFWIEDDASLQDGKLARYLHDLPCRLMRFPGGEVGDNYHWKTGKLDDLRQFPSSEGPDKLDCDKFMLLCRQVGAEPIFVVNLESGFIHNNLDAAVKEAAEWVQYANKEKGYHVKYWEIGNETYLPQTYYPATAREYAEALVKFSRAMKAVDPGIMIGAAGPMEVGAVAAVDRLSQEELNQERGLGRAVRRDAIKKKAATKSGSSGDPWWPTLVKVAGADMDFAIVHRYYPQVFGPDANADKPVLALKQFLAQQLPGRVLPVALTEWNSGKDTPAGLSAALIVAELIGDYLKAGVDMACLWPMRYRGAAGTRTLFDLKTNEPRSSYLVMKLYSSNMGPGSRLIKATSSNRSVYTCASLAGDGKRLTVFLLNKTPAKEGAGAQVAVAGFQGKTAHAVTFGGADLKSDKATLSDTPVTVQAGALSLILPPNSLTVITCE